MQKNDEKKLKLFLDGIRVRLIQNTDFFVSARMQFKMDRQTLTAEISYADNSFFMSFQHKDRKIQIDECMDFFMKYSLQAQESTLHCIERGRETTISCSARGVKMKQMERQATSDALSATTNPLLDQTRQYMIQIDKAAPLLREIGILTEDGKIKNDMIRKYNQIDHYVELVIPMFAEDQSAEFLLLDCACGKSYLSFVLNYYLCEVLGKRCRVIGIDINGHVIEQSRQMAARLGYHNMNFLQTDLREYKPPNGVTAVISLHACDVATDLALVTAVRANAKYIACVPCCHKELLKQYQLPNLQMLTKHGVFHARFNDILTDSLRALWLEAQGYKISVVEYISPLDTPKNLLIRANRISDFNEDAMKEYQAARAALGTTSELDRQENPRTNNICNLYK